MASEIQSVHKVINGDGCECRMVTVRPFIPDQGPNMRATQNGPLPFLFVEQLIPECKPVHHKVNAVNNCEARRAADLLCKGWV